MKYKHILFLISILMIFLANFFILIVVGAPGSETDSFSADVFFNQNPVYEDGSNGGSHPIPSIPLDLNFSVSKIEANRATTILLTLEYCINKTDSINITEFNYIDYLNRVFKIVKVDGKYEKPSYVEIEINGKINISDHKTKNWTLETSNDVAKGPTLLFDFNRRKIDSIEGKSKQKRIIIQPRIRYFYPNNTEINGSNIKISIKNNQPLIKENEARVIVSGPQIGDEPKLIYWEPNNPLEVNHLVSGTDVEDNNKLQYIWTLESENGSHTEFITNLSNTMEKWKLKPGVDYTFKVKAKDLEGSYSKTEVAKIFGKDNNATYDSISVPSWKFYESNLVAILIIAILIVFSSFIINFKSDFCIRKRDILKIIVYKFKNYLTNFTINSLANAFFSILFITIVFILLFYFKIKLFHIYSISLAFYELYIFIIVFILFGYLAEETFFKKDNIHSNCTFQVFHLTAFFISRF